MWYDYEKLENESQEPPSRANEKSLGGKVKIKMIAKCTKCLTQKHSFNEI